MTYQLIDLWKVWFFHDFVTSLLLNSPTKTMPNHLQDFRSRHSRAGRPSHSSLSCEKKKNSSSRYKAAVLPLPPWQRRNHNVRNVINVIVLQCYHHLSSLAKQRGLSGCSSLWSWRMLVTTSLVSGLVDMDLWWSSKGVELSSLEEQFLTTNSSEIARGSCAVSNWELLIETIWNRFSLPASWASEMLGGVVPPPWK